MYTHPDGEMAEWSNAPVLKTGKDASPSRVRIPVSPPLSTPACCVEIIIDVFIGQWIPCSLVNF